ncbi:MAG: putative toxin-antitoxin system toxin component, PIN family [Bacteroidota bacterium]
MPHQIVLDTNVLVAALRSRRGASFKLLSLLTSGRFEINLSNALLFEYEDVLMRQYQALSLTSRDIATVLDFLCGIANLHEVYFLWRPSLRDPRDEMILELAVSASCRYIVTYNKRDFVGVERFGIKVVDAREFLLILQASS